MKIKSVNTKKSLLHGVKTGFLPKKHHFSHAFCFFLHDLIVQTLKEGEKVDVFSISIKLPPEKLPPMSLEDTITWLEKNGYKDEALILIFKQVIKAMIADFGHFTYEALDCSQKGKLSVTFALLRKAFKDHLIYFEWLLADPVDFMNVFKSGNINALSLDRNSDKRKEIIEKAMKILRSYWGGHEFQYEIRYDKKSNCSFEPLWQKANHLVTCSKEYKTELMNFNFIFSTKHMMGKQWDILYGLLPFLLVHTYHVIEALLALFAERVNEKDDITNLRVMMGFILLDKELFKGNKPSIVVKNVFLELGLDKVNCPKCVKNFILDKRNMEIFYGRGAIKCINCKIEIDLFNHELSTYLVSLFNRKYMYNGE